MKLGTNRCAIGLAALLLSTGCIESGGRRARAQDPVDMARVANGERASLVSVSIDPVGYDGESPTVSVEVEGPATTVGLYQGAELVVELPEVATGFYAAAIPWSLIDEQVGLTFNGPYFVEFPVVVFDAEGEADSLAMMIGFECTSGSATHGVCN